MRSAPSKALQRVPNPHVDRDYEVDHVVPEFTSLKLYMWAYRNEGAFHEDVTNRILADLVRTLAPRRMEVVGDWNVRGGIKTVVTVRYESPSWPGASHADRANQTDQEGPPSTARRRRTARAPRRRAR
jgi:7-cyano-7-deazaguanine reductase